MKEKSRITQAERSASVSSCAEYFEAYHRVSEFEWRVFEFEGADVAIYRTDPSDGWFLGPAPFYYSWTFNRQPINLRAFALALGDTLILEADWHLPSGLTREECYPVPTAGFPLATTWDTYLAGLSKKSRYDIRKVNAQFEGLRVDAGLTLPASTLTTLMDVYEEKLAGYFKLEATQATNYRRVMDLFIEYAQRRGSLRALTFYDGTDAVGFNIAEQCDDRMLDIFSIWRPDVTQRGPVGKLAINHNVRYAIALGLPFYDMGPFEMGGDEVVCDYGYKRVWCPKEYEFPECLGFAAVSSELAEKWLQQTGQPTSLLGVYTGFLYPPFYNITRGEMVWS